MKKGRPKKSSNKDGIIEHLKFKLENQKEMYESGIDLMKKEHEKAMDAAEASWIKWREDYLPEAVKDARCKDIDNLNGVIDQLEGENSLLRNRISRILFLLGEKCEEVDAQQELIEHYEKIAYKEKE